MLTGGIKRRAEGQAILENGWADVLGLARAFALWPDLPMRWRSGDVDPPYPRFAQPPEGGVTAWYTMRLTEIGEDRESDLTASPELGPVIETYDARDAERAKTWRARFG